MNAKRMLPIVTLACCIAVAGTLVFAEEMPSVDTIVHEANRVSYYQGADGSAMVTMSITDEQGRTDTRKFVILRRDAPAPKDKTITDKDTYCADQKFYVYFRLPADLNKMVFMVHKHVDGDDDRWLYTPALDNVKRIAASDKRTSFVGSHFLYEDVSGRNLNDDTHELLETTENYYVVKNTPKDPKSVEFAYYTMWIVRGNFLPTQVKYYDARGENYRTYTAKKVETVQGYPTVTKAVMQDHRLKGETLLEYDNVKYDIGLPEDIFTERYLRRAPRKYLR